MSKTFHHGERRIRAQAIRRETPDLRRLARALIDLAQAQAEAAAQADHEADGKSEQGGDTPKGPRSRTNQKSKGAA